MFLYVVILGESLFKPGRPLRSWRNIKVCTFMPTVIDWERKEKNE